MWVTSFLENPTHMYVIDRKWSIAYGVSFQFSFLGLELCGCLVRHCFKQCIQASHIYMLSSHIMQICSGMSMSSIIHKVI